MNFRNRKFLENHIKETLSFYHPSCIDNDLGGYYHQFYDDGLIDDRFTKHLVGTCRFIYIYSISYIIFKNNDYKIAAEQGLNFLRKSHQQSDGGFAWVLNGSKILDDTRYCYGHAFVLLAASVSAKAQINGAKEFISEIYEILENNFWDKESNLYVDEMEKNWENISNYRGQNSNMHMCEAMLSAYEATMDTKYLYRANTLAERICLDLTKDTNGLIWEHYDKEWKPDWEYNKNDPQHMFKPYGYNLGHSIEWAKLLLILDRYYSKPWMLTSSENLFNLAIKKSWDEVNGGMHYTLYPDGKVLDKDRYYWVLAETFAASSLLALKTKNSSYWNLYDKVWEYSYKYFVDHENGGWYRILDSNNNKYSNLKSPPSKTDYHPIGACYETIEAMNFYRYK
tara:strand:+ start:1500 stop:2687 length:1188 start_codon:yes stop_codon:yes gene_type:complete